MHFFRPEDCLNHLCIELMIMNCIDLLALSIEMEIRDSEVKECGEVAGTCNSVLSNQPVERRRRRR